MIALFFGSVATESKIFTTPAPEVVGQSTPPFKTEEYKNRFSAEKSALEEVIKSAKAELESAKADLGALPPAASAEGELERRRLEQARYNLSAEIRSVENRLFNLPQDIQREEKRYLLNRYLGFPLVHVDEWKTVAIGDGMTPRILGYENTQRRVVKTDQGKYALIEVKKISASSPEEVVKTSESWSEFREDELVAITRDQNNPER